MIKVISRQAVICRITSNPDQNVTEEPTGEMKFSVGGLVLHYFLSVAHSIPDSVVLLLLLLLLGDCGDALGIGTSWLLTAFGSVSIFSQEKLKLAPLRRNWIACVTVFEMIVLRFSIAAWCL